MTFLPKRAEKALFDARKAGRKTIPDPEGREDIDLAYSKSSKADKDAPRTAFQEALERAKRRDEPDGETRPLEAPEKRPGVSDAANAIRRIAKGMDK